MPRIQSQQPTSLRATQPRDPAAAPRPAKAAQAESAREAWAPQAGGARSARYPEVASHAKGLVDAYARASKGFSQMEMVEGSVNINRAADRLLREVALELASQLSDRGKGPAGDKVLSGLDAFFKKVGEPRGYRIDPERGSMASLEDNGERLTKVMDQLQKLSAQLGQVNAKPVADFQQAYNRHAGGEALRQEAEFALAFQRKYEQSGDSKLLSRAQTFFKALPKNVDSQVESRGGSLEPLERAGATAEALKKFTAAL